MLASVTVVTLDLRDTGPVQDLRGAASTVFSPLRGEGEAVASPFRNGWHGVTGYDDLEDENHQRGFGLGPRAELVLSRAKRRERD